MYSALKSILIGRPLATSEQERERLPKWMALATFSSDAISSTAYATEEILFVTAAGASSLALGLDVLVPIAVVVAVLLAVVVVSYRQTIRAYPNGGGSYIVSRDNLGRLPSLVAGASLLVDYTLTVAVSVSAGVAAIASIPALRTLTGHRVLATLAVVAFITLANLRGVRESGRLFALPTYTYIAALGGVVAYGLARELLGPGLSTVAFDPHAAAVSRETGGQLGLFLVLRGFSSGAVALSGVEAISNGVPAFRAPEARNASTTMAWMGAILGTLFLGVCVLAHHLHPFPSHDETVVSQMARIIVGNGAYYWVLQVATAGILVLAANTAYADFPRLAGIIARDGYLPHQLAHRGDRLVYSNGVLFLAAAAGALLVAFGGRTNALIPLYAVGVFASFTLSQAGMVAHHHRRRERGWRRGLAINALGALGTAVVTLIVAVTKFTIGAWVPVVVVPAVIAVFLGVRRHYDRLAAELAVDADTTAPPVVNHTIVVLVARVHKGVLKALAYARSLQPDHLVAVYVADEDTDPAAIQADWARLGIEVPLEIVPSPYRELTAPVLAYLDDLDRRWDNDTITVIVPEFVVRRWWEQLLHNQDALFLKTRLVARPNTVVISVPYHVEREPPWPKRPRISRRANGARRQRQPAGSR
jgi:amino acid transporter